MADMQTEVGIKFAKDYYRSITRGFSHASKFFTKDSVIAVSNENEKPINKTGQSIESIASKHKKSIDKVMISSLDCHVIDDLIMIFVVGQYIYDPNDTQRFTEQFVIKKEEKVILINNVRFLNEVVVYDQRREETEIKSTRKPRESAYTDNENRYELTFKKKMTKQELISGLLAVAKVNNLVFKEMSWYFNVAEIKDVEKIQRCEFIKSNGGVISQVKESINTEKTQETEFSKAVKGGDSIREENDFN